MKIINIVSIIALSATLNAGGKYVQRAITPVAPIVAPSDKLSGFYVGLGLGWMRLKDSYTREYFETYPIMLQIGYQYNKYLSFEARYLRDIGNVKYENGITSNKDNSNFPTHFTNYGIYIKPTYPYGKFSFYLLAGYGQVSLTNIEGAKRKKSGLQWGVGAAYNTTKNMKIFADYIRLYDGKGFNGRAKKRNVHVDSIITGVSYVF